MYTLIDLGFEYIEDMYEYRKQMNNSYILIYKPISKNYVWNVYIVDEEDYLYSISEIEDNDNFKSKLKSILRDVIIENLLKDD